MATNWENLIHKRVALAKFCLATENFASFHALAADQARNATIHINLAPEHIEGVKRINTVTVDAGQQSYNEFSTQVERLKEQPGDTKTWEQKIRDSAEDAKRRSNDLIEKAARDAIAYVGSLPEPVRESAGNAFSEGMTAVIYFFEEIYRNFQFVVRAVVEFFRGIWDQITKSWTAVKIAAQAAITLINGFRPFDVPSVRHAFLPISASPSSVQDQAISYLRQLFSDGTAVARLVISKQVHGWEIDIN
ncbi:hypothetical protein F5Y08DRAFT_342251 [Xylaria arbuscula]|nr:hypothetical protein F5Y08DRAFT_342251 [Xylaria arbuscula]